MIEYGGIDRNAAVEKPHAAPDHRSAIIQTREGKSESWGDVVILVDCAIVVVSDAELKSDAGSWFPIILREHPRICFPLVQAAVAREIDALQHCSSAGEYLHGSAHGAAVERVVFNFRPDANGVPSRCLNWGKTVSRAPLMLRALPILPIEETAGIESRRKKHDPGTIRPDVSVVLFDAVCCFQQRAAQNRSF